MQSLGDDRTPGAGWWLWWPPCPPCCSGTWGSSSGFSPCGAAWTPWDAPVASGLGSKLASRLSLEQQPGARARERVSIATAATHSPSWM